MKKKVNTYVLDDMLKYIKDLNPDDYETIFTDESDPEVIEFARKYYADHLPVDLTTWIRVNEPNPNLIYGKKLGSQVCFVRDTINALLYPTYAQWKKHIPLVISTHVSKSVTCPVYQINLKKYGLEIVMSYNFYSWVISINSKLSLDCNFMGLFNPTQKIPSHFCHGFPEDKAYGSYEEDHHKFTIEIGSNYDVYTFFYLLKNYLGIRKEY